MKPFLAFLLALALAVTSATGRAESVVLDDLTWTEVRDALRAGTTTVIIPVGGTEQSGPHMALGKHNVRVGVLASRIASATGHTLVAPTLNYVPEGSIAPPSGHMRFAGTISVPQDAFENLLAGAARSLRQHGFRDIVLIGDHGGYQDSLKNVALRLNREWAGTTARAHYLGEYYQAASREYSTLLKSRGFSDAQIGLHAGLADTSLMLAVDPSRVRPEAMRAAPAAEAVTGVVGQPAQSTVELGKAGTELIVERTVRALRQALATRR